MVCDQCKAEIKGSDDQVRFYFSHIRAEGGLNRFEYEGHSHCFSAAMLKLRMAVNSFGAVGV